MAAGLLSTAMLAGCSPGPATTVPATSQPAPFSAAFLTGTVVAVRPVSITGDGGSRRGVNSVLAALQAPASSGAIVSQEIVIRRLDGNAISIADPQTGFAVGDHVAILESDTSTLLNRD